MIPCFLFVSGLLFLVSFSITNAAPTTYTFPVTIADSADKIILEQAMGFPFDIIQSIAAIDLGSDNTSELVLGSPKGFEPRVFLARLDGSIINSWLAYGEDFKGGVNVAASDLDNDGIAEIVTAPAGGGSAHIRTFDGFGNPVITPGFFAGSQSAADAVLVSSLSYADKPAIAVLITRNQSSSINIFSADGTLLADFLLDESFETIHAFTRIDLGGDQNDELAISADKHGTDHTVFLYRTDGSFINSFSVSANASSHLQSITKTAAPGEHLLANARANQQYEIYDGFGERLKTSTPADSPAGLVSIPIRQGGIGRILSVPKRVASLDRADKAISIDLSDQKLSYYEDGFRIDSFSTSTGRRGYETPIGTFAINAKTDRAYSKTYGLYMPYWMSFIGSAYGIHELPEWPGGYKEGADHLGTPVSHGCVRVGVGSAQTLYEWAVVGTPVIVRE